MALAEVLNKDWEVAGAGQRVWRATFFHEAYGWRVAQILQYKGIPQFQVGIVRDISEGGAAELKAYAMGTPEAVVWLGLHRSQTPVEWLLTL